MLGEMKEWVLALEHAINKLHAWSDNLKKEFRLDDLKDSLNQLPDEIAHYQKEAVKTRASIVEIESGMKFIEVELSYVINMETNGKDKPKFSNDNLRKAELIRRLEQNDPYQEAKREKVNLESILFNSDIEIDRLRNLFKSSMALKDLIVAELNLYTK